MLFHQCIYELADNAIAAAKVNVKIAVNIAFEVIDNEPDYFNLYVCDNGQVYLDKSQLQIINYSL